MALILRWPLPALFSWALAWLLFTGLQRAGLGPLPALIVAAGAGAGLALLHHARWRRLIVALGFPVSLLTSGGLPAWLWLLPLALLVISYPRSTWGDAPLFPTPALALAELPAVAVLTSSSSVLDAGCGLGHGLVELHRAYPQLRRLVGVEWSRLLAPLARWRCRGFAEVQRGDMWAADWSGFEMVYVFQRPESMPRVWAKACEQMRAGAWLVSLDFEVEGEKPHASWQLDGGHSVWVYRLGSQASGIRADMAENS